MNVIEIKPNGLCGGVIRAIKMIIDAINNPNTIKPIYMMGNLIHNKHVVKSFTDQGIILIKDNYEASLDIINSGTIIFTAHGISPKIYKKAKDKGLNIIDTTCPKVLKIHNRINELVNNDTNVLVIGNSNHPEVIGYLGISDKVSIYQEGMDTSRFNYVVNQTTLVYDDVLKVFEKIKEKNNDITIHEEICTATKERQFGLKESLDKIDCLVVVGDKTSNNCNSLVSLGKNNNIPSFLIESVEDINNYDFSNYKLIGVTSGASTPRKVLLEAIDALTNYNKNTIYKTKLNNDDYLIL